MDTVLLNGFFVGLVYGLVGVGLVVVYRGSRVVNFAYGETGMVAAMVFADLRYGTAGRGAIVTDNGLVYALPLAVALAAAVGAATEFFVVRPLREAPRIQALVGTFAVGALLLTFGVRRWGTSVRIADPLAGGDGIRLAGLQVSAHQLLILVVSLTVLVSLWALYRFTAFGLRLRAAALDPYAAGLTGVNVDATSMATWALAGALAGLSAILIAPLVALHTGFMVTLTIRGLIAALVGGLTSIWGAFAAGVLLAMAEGVIAFKSPVSGITDVVAAAFVLGLMVWRPSGLVRAAY